MVRGLGEYEGIRMFHDDEMYDKNIVFGDAKKRKMANGEMFVPMDEYKKAIKEEPFIPDNSKFRLPKVSDHKKEVKVTWIIGGSEDVEVYKDAIDLIKRSFSLL